MCGQQPDTWEIPFIGIKKMAKQTVPQQWIRTAGCLNKHLFQQHQHLGASLPHTEALKAHFSSLKKINF